VKLALGDRAEGIEDLQRAVNALPAIDPARAEAQAELDRAFAP
jgi:hypothetical protein